jgi:hypothetical protein
LGFFRIGIINHLDQNSRNNLPLGSVFVVEPAAHLRFFIPALREFAPVMIHLSCVSQLTWNEMASLNGTSAAVEGGKRLPVELEGDGHYRSRGFTMLLISRFAVARNVNDRRIREDASVKRNCLFSLIIKSQAWGDFLNLHGISPTRF